MSRRIAVPAALEDRRALGPRWGRWLDLLPGRTADLLEEWALVPDGAATHGHASLVLPVRTADGDAAALKLTYDGDEESRHEGLALQHWQGDGTVRLLRADPARRALLLERLHPVDLGTLDDLEACAVVAGTYTRLHRPALPQLAPYTDALTGWLGDLRALPRDAPVPRRLVEQALSLGTALLADPASTGRIVHGDLHYGNVLAAGREPDGEPDREPWLVIDPKPMSGDPHLEPAPMLWNRWDELVSSGRLREALRARFHTLVDVAGLDEDRARDWVVVRSVVNAQWSLADAARADRSLDVAEREWITRMVTTAKAVQD